MSRSWLTAMVSSFILLAGGLRSPIELTAQTYGVAVTPDGGFTPNRTAHTSGHTQIFRVTNEGTASQAFNFVCVGASQVTCTGLSQSSATIPGNSFLNVTATYSVGSDGTGQLAFTATGPQSTDQGVIGVPIVLPAGAPRIVALPYLESKQDYSRCAASCFAATYSHSTVPYFSLDQPRNVTLVYHGDRIAPKPIVAVDVYPDTTFGSWPSEYQFQVLFGGVAVSFINGETMMRFAGTSGSTRYRLAGQFVDAIAGHVHGGVYPMEILVTAKIGASFYTNRWFTHHLHIDESKSKIARGWTVAGIQRAYKTLGSGMLITEGDGSATYFRFNPITKKYDAPDGDFSRVDSTSGNIWIRNYPDSTKVRFNSTGFMTSVRSRWGDSTWVTYDGSSRIATVKDHFANTITLAYAANGLSSITDPTSRVTTVSVASDSTLSWIQDPDNLKTTFGYTSKRLTTITARNNKVTTLAYDTTGKLSSITRPSVPIFGGGSSSPVTSFLPWQKLGVPYASTAVTPFPVVRADTAYARVTEPGGGLTRFSVNRWGAPVKTILPAADGSRDSTIVQYSFAGLPARIVRPGYGVSDFDSLAYNGSGQVELTRFDGHLINPVPFRVEVDHDEDQEGSVEARAADV